MSNQGEADLRLPQMMAYAAPIAAVFFFYVPMWSILSGIYAKYFGLKLTAIAAAILGSVSVCQDPSTPLRVRKYAFVP